MGLKTASETIAFVKELERKSGRFYEDAAQVFGDLKEILLRFVKENDRHVREIERIYYSIITDAIEGCFAYDLQAENYGIDELIDQGTGDREKFLGTVLQLEETIKQFYLDAAGQAKALMVDVPRVMERIAKERERRITEIKKFLLA